MLDITPSSLTKRGPILKDFKHELCQNEPLDIAGQYLRGIDGDRDVTGYDVTGSWITGSDRKWRHRKLHDWKWLYRKWCNGKCKGDNFSRRVFAAFFLRKHLGVYSETLGVSHRKFNFARRNIDQWNARIPLSISQPRFSL